MSKSKRKTRELVDEDRELEDVLKTLLDVQEEKGEVEWSDVKTEATSGQWGRLIEKGILVDSDDGFVFKDEKAVKQALGIETEDESEEDEGDVTVSPDVETPGDVDTGWSYLDKGAALVGLFFIIFGYRDPAVQAAIGGVIDAFVAPLHGALGLPYYLIILVLATLTGLYSGYLQLYLMDWDWISAQQEKVQEIQSQLKEAQMSGDDDRKQELKDEQKEVMSEQMKMFKMQFKPSVWIMVLTIPIFIWMYWNFTSRGGNPPAICAGTEACQQMPQIQMPFVGNSEFSKSVIGFLPIGQAWFVWYILCSFGFGQVMRKVLGVNPTT